MVVMVDAPLDVQVVLDVEDVLDVLMHVVEDVLDVVDAQAVEDLVTLDVVDAQVVLVAQDVEDPAQGAAAVDVVLAVQVLVQDVEDLA